MYEGKQYRNIRALVGALNPVWITVMVRKDFLERSGHQILEDIFTSGDAVRWCCSPGGSK